VAVAGLDAVGKALTEEVVFRSTLFSRISGLALSEDITETSIASVISHDMSSVPVSAKESLKIVFLNKADTLGALHAGRRLAASIEQSGSAVFDRIIIGELRGEPLIYTCNTLPQRRVS
jgi:probable selenium-dependent hydroxylase accessory protein YqeC